MARTTLQQLTEPLCAPITARNARRDNLPKCVISPLSMHSSVAVFTCKLAIFALILLAIAPLAAWDSKIHTGIIRAALMAIPADDHIQERLGSEVWSLPEYVQMGDWINMLVRRREDWDAGGQTLEQPGPEFFANDYLLFPAAPRAFQHDVPDVKATYRPFFLRSLQALRTESHTNAARWIGSLLHFVTDSGSPPHTIGVHGSFHVKMESWLDTSVIDLSRYRPKLLGDTDEAAVTGLLDRMNGLIAFSAVRGKQMLPFVKVDDRAHMEPLAVESAAETARVAADVIHTLLKLTFLSSSGGSLVAQVSAPTMDGLEKLPAKLVLLDTNYSTLSDESLPGFHQYQGTLSLRNIPPGTYRPAIERVGNQTLFLSPLIATAGETIRQTWTLQPARAGGNLMPNPDLALHWLTPDAPDHWRFDSAHTQWISDEIPVVPGRSYRAGCELKHQPAPQVELQWMAHAWQAMKIPAVPFDFSRTPRATITATAPADAIFARFVVKTQRDPSAALTNFFITAENLPNELKRPLN